jgi:drug/metabolite transporter (DMT)-like permease
VTAALLGTALLGEPLTAGTVGGLVLVVTGLGLALR